MRLSRRSLTIAAIVAVEGFGRSHGFTLLAKTSGITDLVVAQWRFSTNMLHCRSSSYNQEPKSQNRLQVGNSAAAEMGRSSCIVLSEQESNAMQT